LASSSQNIGDELNKLQTSVINSSGNSSTTTTTSNNKHNSSVLSERAQASINQLQQQQPIKRPVQNLIIKSKSEYMANFKAIISQNLKIKTRIGEGIPLLNLTKLVINNCGLKQIDGALFELESLTTLDLSMNKLCELNDFSFWNLNELIVANNQIKHMGTNIRLPRICILDLSHNQLNVIDKHFCMNFQTLKCLKINHNRIKSLCDGFGYYLSSSLSNFYANNNELNCLPYSCSYLRLEMLELQDNPFEYNLLIMPNLNNLTHKKFPTLVELSARFISNKK
jgi:hypothetical protein